MNWCKLGIHDWHYPKVKVGEFYMGASFRKKK